MVSVLLLTLRTSARSRAALQLDVLALRHQPQVLKRTTASAVAAHESGPLALDAVSGIWTGWRTALVIVKPDTVIGWHRRGLSAVVCLQKRRMGRPTVPADVRPLIRTMVNANPCWGRSADSGELLKLGIGVCQATAAKYMARWGQPPPDLAHFPAESHRPDRGGRFLRRPADLPPLVRPGSPRPRSATLQARGG